MASYIKFYPKGSDQTEENAVVLTSLDEEICKLVGEPIDPKKYCRGWFDVIAFWLSNGKTYAQIREQWTKWDAEREDPIYHKWFDPIADHLEANYDHSRWSGR